MKRLLIVLLFFLFSMFPSLPFRSFSEGGLVFAQSSPTQAASPQPSLWDIFWNWITGIFIKNKYDIDQRPVEKIFSDMTDYGEASDDTKHSSSGPRLRDKNSEDCDKGYIIKNVILKTGGYTDHKLAKICLDSDKCVVKTLKDSSGVGCSTVSITNLAIYFVQINQPFYCDDNNKIIDIESNVVSAVNQFVSENSLPEIPSRDFDCYKTIHDDFYLVPQDNIKNEKNAKNIVQNPISASDQDPNDDASLKDLKKQLNQNFTPDNSGWKGLNSLRPNGW